MHTLKVLFSPYGIITAQEADSAAKRLYVVVFLFLIFVVYKSGGLTTTSIAVDAASYPSRGADYLNPLSWTIETWFCVLVGITGLWTRFMLMLKRSRAEGIGQTETVKHMAKVAVGLGRGQGPGNKADDEFMSVVYKGLKGAPSSETSCGLDNLIERDLRRRAMELQHQNTAPQRVSVQPSQRVPRNTGGFGKRVRAR
ncbi:MAG: hypothetical protein AAF903_00520 [Pseudomonadota bacterium]